MDRKKIIWPILMAGTAAMNHAEALTPAAAKPAGTPEIQTEENAPQNRPNILWLTFEDTSFYEFGCYGNLDVHTPNTDSLAAHGVLFTNAWSNAPQSSPARSSLITGCYATTYGMDIHPVSTDTPENILFPQLLRDAGYYCTNNRKTHYNTTTDNRNIIIPNGALSNGTINNYSQNVFRRLEWLVDVEYGAPSDKVKSLLKKIVDEEKRIVYAPTAPANPTIALNALRDSSVQFVVRAWVKKEEYWDVLYDVNEKIYNEIPENGIQFPYPQLDVHIAGND